MPATATTTMHHEELVYQEILRSLPPLDFAFAYGSGVFEQEGYNDDKEPPSPPSPSSSSLDYSALPMLDLVLAVRNPIEWHQQNLERNWGHYSVLRYLGAERLGQIQGNNKIIYIVDPTIDSLSLTHTQHTHTFPPEDYGAAIYYNTSLPVPGQKGRRMKYGVISTHALRRDLLDWRWMYAAGKNFLHIFA